MVGGLGAPGTPIGVNSAPPMNFNCNGSASSFWIDKRHCVGWPFTSLTPKNSALGNDADSLMARLADWSGALALSLAYHVVSKYVDR